MGCDFVLKSAKDWPDRYLCKTRRQEGCTFDNRRPAVCDLSTALAPPSPQFQVRELPHICLCTSCTNLRAVPSRRRG